MSKQFILATKNEEKDEKRMNVKAAGSDDMRKTKA